MSRPGGNVVAGYVLVLLILAVLTYVEFAIVEYPQEWLGRAGTLASLIIMSIGKFILVILYFMHLKEDDVVYSGWFASGMFLALGSFIGFVAMFVYPTAMQTFPKDPVNIMSDARAAQAALLIPGDGVARTAAEQARHPAPADQSVAVTPPLAEAGEYDVTAPSRVEVPAADEAEEAAEEATEDTEATDVAEADEPEAADEDAVAAADDEEDETLLDQVESVIDDAVGATEDAAEAVADTVTEVAQDVLEAAEAVVDDVAEAIGATNTTWDEEAGASFYQQRCISCHQVTGEGIPGAFPPLKGHSADVYALDGGPEFLVNVLLFGLDGAIEVNGITYRGVPMPAWKQYSDDEIAAVANHIVAGFDGAPSGFVPFTADDVAAERSNNYTNKQVYELRTALDL